MELTSKDLDRIETIKTLFSLSVRTSTRTDQHERNRRYRIQVGSKSFVEELSRLGFGPRKSKRLQFPKLPDRLFAAFVRGYFDGDGNVMFKHYCRKARTIPSPFFRVVFTSCSGEFLSRLLEKLRKRGVVRKGSVRSEADFYRLVLAPRDSLSLGQFMYNGFRCKATPFVLARKQRIFAAARTFYRERTKQKPQGV